MNRCFPIPWVKRAVVGSDVGIVAMRRFIEMTVDSVPVLRRFCAYLQTNNRVRHS
jgi:hypothetical protein